MSKFFFSSSKLFIVFLFFYCSSSKNIVQTLDSNQNTIDSIRYQAMVNLSKSYKASNKFYRKFKNEKLIFFRVYEYNVYNEYYTLSISHQINRIPLRKEDSIGKVPKTFFPNNYLIIGDKVFLWRDDVKPLNVEILNLLEDYGLLNSINSNYESEIILNEEYDEKNLIIVDDKLKGFHYYFCKNNINKYRKVKTNIAVGYYAPPKINCN